MAGLFFDFEKLCEFNVVFLDAFLILKKNQKEKRGHQNQDPAESWKHQFLNTFLFWIFEQEKAAAKTKILPKARKIEFWKADMNIELHDLGLVGGMTGFSYDFNWFSDFNVIFLGCW